jgi:cytochrome P450
MTLPDRLLMPVFGAAAIRDMFPAMEDVISQLVAKWERSVSHGLLPAVNELNVNPTGLVLTM